MASTPSPQRGSDTLDDSTAFSSRWLRFFRLCNRAFLAFLSVGSVMYEGLWLGLLSPRDLTAVILQHYANSEMYLTKEYNLSGFFPWEKAALDRFFSGRTRFLIAGAGAGRETIALSKDGKQATGFDCCRGLVEFGLEVLRAENIPAELLCCPTDQFPDSVGTFEAGIVGWTAYSLIQGSAQRIKFLKKFAAHLHQGSPLLLSFVSRHADWRSDWAYRIANALRALRRGESPIEYGDRLVLDLRPLFLHEFSKQEIANELAAAGFQLEFYSDIGTCPHCVARVAQPSEN
jgi:hypothetical protein